MILKPRREAMFGKKKNNARIELFNTGGDPQNGPTVRAVEVRDVRRPEIKYDGVGVNVTVVPPGIGIGPNFSVKMVHKQERKPVTIEWEDVGPGYWGKIKTDGK
jgi:hypothetical protein